MDILSNILSIYILNYLRINRKLVSWRRKFIASGVVICRFHIIKAMIILSVVTSHSTCLGYSPDIHLHRQNTAMKQKTIYNTIIGYNTMSDKNLRK